VSELEDDPQAGGAEMDDRKGKHRKEEKTAHGNRLVRNATSMGNQETTQTLYNGKKDVFQVLFVKSGNYNETR